MLFFLSNTLGFITVPSNALMLVCWVGGLMMTISVSRRWGRWALAMGLVLLGVCSYLPVGSALLLPLEQRFPHGSSAGQQPSGIIVLGGIDPEVSTFRDTVELTAAGDRIVAVAQLARQYPTARILLSGGAATIFSGVAQTEAAFAKRLLINLGIDGDRLTIEDKSRNTAENAQYSKSIANPRSGERWLLVTSAAHMPRAVGAFRGADFPVEAYPVDYRTTGRSDIFRLVSTASHGLDKVDVAVHEWVGLLIYRLVGLIPELLPGP
jgi:uncharacterized SAM-binding protein YcdF (DUF218 family)